MARRLRQEAGPGLSPSLTAALATVERHGPLTPSGLADLERIQRPTATRVIEKLVGEGLVEKTRDPDDGRAFLVSVSKDGRALIRKLRSRKSAYLEKRLRALEPEDRATLARASEILERMLREES
ncbi:MAG: MarR family transcriptional regulator [Thermoleophilaceae bacterium]|nr:MarR family transcriptional regulator [Thermoleophilaceae bacterium]